MRKPARRPPQSRRIPSSKRPGMPRWNFTAVLPLPGPLADAVALESAAGRSTPGGAGEPADVWEAMALCGAEALRPCARHKEGEAFCMPVLRTEALLRLSPPYISATRSFFDSGSVPPAYLDEAVELQALQVHGFEASEESLRSYRSAARDLLPEVRAEIFFLRANDRLFRPCAEVLGRRLEGAVRKLPPDGTRPLEPVCFEGVLDSVPRAILVASTSS
uniref:Uncharacterized protein n=1 Tax=Alexandrium monilatum TaxID=311494 RepID=A0A7S4SQS9_9DINO